MKKTIFVISIITTLLIISCSKENGQKPINGKEVTLTASVSDTKVSEAAGVYGWQTGDAISVFTTASNNVNFTTTTDGATASFTGTIADGDAIGSYAMSPAINGATIAGTTITAYLPTKYTYVAGSTNMLMVGSISGTNITFTPAGGVIRFNLTNIPTTAKGFKFEVDAKDPSNVDNPFISGNSAINASTNSISATGDRSVIIDFSSATYVANRTFYIPVPASKFTGFTIGILDAATTSGKYIYSLHSPNQFEIAANHIAAMPTVAIPDMTSGTTAIPTSFTEGKSVNLYNEYVVAVGKTGYVISDNPVSGNNLYCFTTASATKPAVGDKINVSGPISLYGGIYEVKYPDFVVVSNSNSFSYPSSATDITSNFSTYSGITNQTSEYIKFTGSFAVSGNYYNITVGTNTIKGSLSTANDYSRYNGQTVTVTGYYIGKTSTTYQNLVPTSISADPFFNLPTTSTNVTAIAGTVTFNVNANVDWTAAAASGNTMSISSVVADKAAGTVTVTYAENTASSAKTGVINVVTTDSNIATKTLTYTITQSAAVSGSRALASTDYVLGSNAYDVTVNGYSGFKFGTSSKTGSMTINPGFKSITLYAAGWSGDAATLSVTNGTPASTTLESDTVLTGSSPFTGVTKITTITITVTDPTSSVALSSVKAAKGRVVIWNIQVVPKS